MNIQIATANFFNEQSLTWPENTVVNICKEAGYSGLQYHPTRMIRSLSARNPDLRTFIGSFHQSWRQERWPWQWILQKNKKLSAASYVLLPYWISSLDELTQLQTTIGKDIPIVVYPTHTDIEAHKTKDFFRERTVQLCPELIDYWKIDPAGKDGKSLYSAIRTAYEQRGYAVCFDSLHALRPSTLQPGYKLPPYQDALEVLGDLIQEGHIRAGSDQGNTVQITKALLNGNHAHPTLKMWEEVRQVTNCRLIIEIPAEQLSLARGYRNLSQLDEDDYAYDYQRILTTMEGIWAVK